MTKEFTVKLRRVMWFLALSTSLLCDPALAQTVRVNGRVTDVSEGNPIPGANVIIKGTTSGTTTDSDGKYTLEASNADAVLIFSFIGYATKEFPLNGRTVLDVVMDPDVTALQEIVIVGYGSQIGKEITGSVQQVKSEQLRDLPVAQVTQKLQGRLAGVQISQNTGKPGQGMAVRIRGQASILAGSDPLYVVDGFPIVGNINNINPDEIESITVLKDAASTSLYGSRAANGVILVKTKSAQGGKNSIDFNAFYGTQQVPQQGRPQMMNGTEFAQFRKESYEDRGQPVPAEFQNPSQYGEGYDWYGGMLRNAPIQNYSIGVNTGTDKFSTSAVMGYFNQDGVMHNSNYKRYSLRINSEVKIKEKVKVGFNLAPTYATDNTPSSDGAFYATNINAAVPGGLLYNALLTWPILPYENPDGSLPLTAWIPGLSAFPAPNWYRSLNEVKNETQTTRILANAFVDVTILKGLKFNSTLSSDFSNASFFNFQPSTTSTTFTALPPTVATSFRRSDRYISWLNENLLTYSFSANDHNLEILAGFTTQKFRSDADQIRATAFPDDRIQTIQSAINIDRTQTFSDVQEWSLMSVLARANYAFKGKYLLGLAIRRDGSSRFGSDNRWGNFPSVSAGWVVSDEAFVPRVKAISLLKLRASYGVIGNNNIGNYTQYATVNTTTNAIFGANVASGASVVTLANSNLGWETTKQLDVGVDIGLLQDRISFVYDYYTKRTTNLLYNVAVPQESGFTAFNGNIGELKFWGHEFTVSSKNLVGKLKWTTDFNLSFNDNKVMALSNGVNRLYSGGAYTTITMVGQRIEQFWGLVQDGVYVDQQDFDSSPRANTSEVGTIKYRDINGDGVITFGGDNDDRTVIGNPFPRAVFGLTNTLSYNNIDLAIVFSGTSGNDVMVMTDQGATNLDGVFNVLSEIKDRWRSPSNPGAGKYGKTTAATFMERDWGSTRFVSDGSNVTVRNITLGYNVPLKNGNAFRNIRVYASGQNLHRFTKYRGANPEVSAQANGTQGTTLIQGFDWATFPVPRVYTLGLNIGF